MFKIVAKLDKHAVHSVGYYSKEKAEKVARDNPGKFWTDQELAKGGFEVVEDFPTPKRKR